MKPAGGSFGLRVFYRQNAGHRLLLQPLAEQLQALDAIEQEIDNIRLARFQGNVSQATTLLDESLTLSQTANDER